MSAKTTPSTVLTHEVDKQLGKVLGNSFPLGANLQNLHLIREKIHARHYQAHDKEEIIAGLQQLNYQVQKLYSSMEALNHLLSD